MTTFRAPSSAGTIRPSSVTRFTARAVAAWCLLFAAVNVLQLLTGRLAQDDLASYATGIAVMAVLVLVLKVIGAGVALTSIRPAQQPSWLLGAALWGMASLLVLYSLGNVMITVVTASGLTGPSEAWEAAGGVTGRTVAYLVFFLAAAPLFTVLAFSYQRRLRPRWSALVAGVIGAPLLLGTLLVAAPAVLSAMGLLP